MANTYQPLECDTDILMIGKDTFTVQRFKELTVEKITSSFNISRYREGSMFDILRKHMINIFDNSLVFNLRNIELVFPSDGRECKILKSGYSEWQTGKIRINLMVKSSYNRGASSEVKLIKLEFCYDEPPEPESPLDDIRQREDYQQLLNNQ